MAKRSWEINPAGIQLSKKSVTPLYLQLYGQVREMIVSGRLRVGERLPAGRTLAGELGVARVIVSRAYEQLILEGYLVGRTGAGTFVADQLPEHLLNAAGAGSKAGRGAGDRAAGAAGSGRPADQQQRVREGYPLDVAPFQTGVPALDLFPYKVWQEVAGKVLKNFKTFNLGYDDTLGYPPLREAIASYLRIARAVKCEASQVVIVTGSQQGLNLIAECLLQKGDKVWMENPGYGGALGAFRWAGAEICPVPLEEDGLDIDFAIKTYGGAKLVYTTPSHQFPMGYVLSQTKRRRLLDYAQKKKLWIVEDDYDGEFRYEGRPLASLQGQDTGGVVIYSGTFSKVLFPGLRLAYLVLPTEEMVNQFRMAKTLLDRQSPILDQLILSAFMQEGHFPRHIRKMRLLYAERQKKLLQLIRQELPEYLVPQPAPAGLHLVCQLSDKVDWSVLRQEAERTGVIIHFIRYHSPDERKPPAIVLGFTAFTKYKMKIGVEKLGEALRRSLR